MADKKAALNAELEAAIAAELARVRKDLESGEPKMGMTDRCRVYDRALKLEALRLKADDDWGGMFDDPNDDPTTED